MIEFINGVGEWILCDGYAVTRGFCRRNRFPAAESEFVSLFEKATRSARGSDTDARSEVPRGMASAASAARQAALQAARSGNVAQLPRAGGLMPPWPTYWWRHCFIICYLTAPEGIRIFCVAASAVIQTGAGLATKLDPICYLTSKNRVFLTSKSCAFLNQCCAVSILDPNILKFWKKVTKKNWKLSIKF